MIGKKSAGSVARDLFSQQLASATRAGGDVDLKALGELVVSAYETASRDQCRTQQSVASMMQKLDEMHQHLVDAFDVLPEGIVLFDAEDRFVMWNRRYAELCGESAGELAAGKRFEDMLRAALERGHFAEAAGREEEWLAERLASHGQPASTRELRLTDGRWVRVEERRTANGGSVGVRIDITESKQREESFRLLFDENPMPMWVLDLESHKFLAVNQAAIDRYGYSREQFLALTAFDIRPPEDREAFARHIRSRGETTKPGGIWRHQRAGGSQIYVLVFGRSLRYQGRRARLNAIVDVTAKELAEDRLREQKLQTETAVNNMSQGLVLFDASGCVVVCNRRYIEMYGLSPDVVKAGCSFRDLIQHRKDTGSFDGDIDRYCLDIRAQISTGQSTEIIWQTADGRSIQIVNRPVTGGGWVATHEDITDRQRLLQEQQQAQELVRQQKLHLDTALNNMMQGLCMFDAEGRAVLCNPRYAEMTGLPSEEIIGRSLLDILKRQRAAGKFSFDPEKLFAEVRGNARMGRSTTKIIERQNGHAMRVVDQPMPDGGWVATFEDITEQRTLERERDRDREFLNLIIDNVPTMIVVKDARDRKFVLANRAAENHWGMSRSEVIGKTARELFPPVEADMIELHDDRALQANAPLVLEPHASITHSGNRRIVTSKRLAVRGSDGAPRYLVSVVDDVTERTRANERIAHLAHYDALTDLPNRVLFREHLEQSLKWIRRGQRLAVLYLDIDEFKSVNDTLGHPVGDELLKAVASRLRSCLRETDIVARLGGDEFAIIQTAVEDPTDVSNLAKRLHQAIQAPYDLAGHHLVTNTSIGIALAPYDGTDPDQLLKNADLAMYGAKADGHGTYRFFEPDMDARVKARRALEFDLREAIMCGGFELHYQPLVDVQNNSISGCEALVRWRHPERGLISPAEFIFVAEDTGLINQLGEWVLRTACAEAMQWPSDIKVAVNVSPVQFKSGNIVQTVISALATTRLPARRLELEITEAVLIRDDEKVLAVLHQLRNLGVRIAMDDFGTGYSSLSYLQRFPFDKIKIDRSFIKDIGEPDGSLAIVQAVVGIAKSRNITTTAEGVETAEQLESLRTIGCNEAQGYLFSPPRPAAEVPQFFSALADRIAAVA
jgi:diguanylate cyclase (GGDEF)-like protein/PAS domain S-box-containing protein